MKKTLIAISLVLAGCMPGPDVQSSWTAFGGFVDSCKKGTVRHEWKEGEFTAKCEPHAPN